MADAFRGLTIKIGADARPLNSALSSINTYANSAQKQLRQMQNALKVDASNARLLGNAFELAKDKAALTARSVEFTTAAIKQASGEMLQFSKQSGLGAGSISKIAAKTNDVYAAVQRITAARTRDNAELQRIWDKVAKIYADENKINVKSDEVAKKLRQFKNSFSGTSEEAAKLRREVEALVRKVGNTDLGAAFGLTQAAPGSKEMLGNASKMWGIFSRLRKESKLLQSDLEMLEKVEGFKAMQYKAAALNMELRQSVAEAVRFRSEIQKTGYGAFSSAIEKAKRLDSVIEKSSNDARTMEYVLSALPRSIDAINAKWRASKAEQEAIRGKLEAVNNIIAKIEKRSGLKKTQLSAENVYAATAKATSNMELYSRALELANAKLERLEEEQRQFTAINKKSSDEITAELNKVRKGMDTIRMKILEADSAMEKANMAEELLKASNAALKLQADLAKVKERASVLTALTNWGRSFRSSGYGLYSTITPAIMIAGRYAIQAADDVDVAYRNMRKTVNATEEEFEHLRDAALEFSQTHVTTADTILEIEALGGQLGIASENLESFAEVVSNLDIATDIDAEDLATYIGQLSNIMNDIKIHKDDPEEYKKSITSFSDALVRLGNNSAAQESNIMKVMMRIASLGTISGFTTPELLAIADAVAATGQGAEAAGTAISKTFSNIETAVSAGGNALQGFADVAGITAEEFADAWENDPIKAFTAFIGGLKRIDQEGGSVDSTLRGLGITAVRQKQALMGLTQTYDVLTGSLDMANEAWNGLSSTLSNGKIEEAGDAAREAQRKSEGFSGELQMMKNNAVLFAQELAEGALPYIKEAGNIFKDLADKFKTLPDGMKQATVGLAGFLAAIGPTMVGVGALAASFKPVRDMVMVLPNLFLKAAAALNTMNVSTTLGMNANLALQKVFATLGNPAVFAGVIAGTMVIGKIVEVIQDVIKKQDNYRKSTTELSKAVTGTIPTYSRMRSELDGVDAKIASVKRNNDELFESIAKTAEGIAERNKQAQVEIDLLQNAENTIRDYMNQTGLSAQKQGELMAAVQIVNEKLGTEYKVVDAVNGKIADGNGVLLETSDAIAEYIDARQKQIKIDALAADAADLLAAKSDAYKTYVSDLNEYLSLKKQYDESDATTKSYLQDSLDKAKADSDAAKAAYDSLSAEYKSVTTAMGDAAAASEGARQTLGQMANYSDEFRGAFESTFGASDRPWTEYFDSFRKALDSANIDTETFKNLSVDQIAELAIAWKNSGGDIEETFESIGIDIQSLSGNFNREMDSIGVSFKDLASSLGTDTVTLSAAFDAVGISASSMATIGKDRFDDLVAAADGDMAALVSLVSQELNVEVTADTTQAVEEIATANQMAEQYGESEEDTSLGANTEEAEAAFNAMEDEGETYDNSTYKASADLDTSSAYSKINSLITYMENNWAGRTFTAGTSSEARAAGGLFSNTIRAIPRHASGGLNGIVTRATLTNVGWVGEAGDEALVHMKHAGGAIIPLSNRQHVRPFARAVAAEMGYGNGGSTTVYEINISDFAINDDAEIRNATRDYLGVLMRKGAMNVG